MYNISLTLKTVCILANLCRSMPAYFSKSYNYGTFFQLHEAWLHETALQDTQCAPFCAVKLMYRLQETQFRGS